jgi:hypothetical protein
MTPADIQLFLLGLALYSMGLVMAVVLIGRGR